MAINLQELRAAVQNYLDTSVKVSISNITPKSGTQLNPNEEFTFSVTADNSIAGPNAIQLINVRYHVKLNPIGVAKLLAPNSPATAATVVKAFNNPQGTGTPFVLNQSVDEMYVFFSGLTFDQANVLSPGDTDTIGLKGRAGSAPGGGATNIQVRILADPDLAHLFPKEQDTPTISKPLNVVG